MLLLFSVRVMLGSLVVYAWRRFYHQVKSSFGVGIAAWLTLITVSQFHFMYYLTRTLPNTFALIFALLAFSYWLEQDHWKFILSSGIGIAVFRTDLALILGPMLLHDLYTARMPWTRYVITIYTLHLALKKSYYSE